LNVIAEVATQSLAELLATTYFYVEKKFARSTHPQTLSRFSHKIIVQDVRYCPLCLVQYGFRQLIWQFPKLLVCPHHGVPLLDRCPHCKSPMRSCRAPFNLLKCAVCGEDLMPAEVFYVEDMLNIARRFAFDFRVSVDAHVLGNGKPPIVRMLGKVLSKHRIE